MSLKHITIALSLIMSAPSAFAFGDQKLIRSVNPGGTVHIRNYYIYQLNPCRSMPPPAVDARTPTLGRISTTVVDVTPTRGPCEAGFKYQALRVSYHAGSVGGVDKFTLFVFNGSSPTPIPVEVRVGGRAQQVGNNVAQPRTNARQTEKPTPNTVTSASVAQKPTSTPVANSKVLTGRYTNNLGNIVSIENGVIYFTGYWNREKVARKPFAIISHDGNEFEWGVYKCSGNSVEFRCSNMRRDQNVLYRRMK